MDMGNCMRAIPITYKGINFRSKLEARWYIFMKSLGWNVEYEPEVEGLNNWLPDFLIIGNGTKILVEVKPFNSLKDFSSDYAVDTFKKINNSNWSKLSFDAVIVVGSTLNLGRSNCGESFIGGEIMRPVDVDEDHPDGCYSEGFVYTDHSNKIGICDDTIWYQDVINNNHDGFYNLENENREQLEIFWNKAGSKLQWMPR